MQKTLSTLAALLACATAFGADVRTDCPADGRNGPAELHRDWLMTGWERAAGDAPFNFRQDLGRYYDFTRTDLSLFDDFDPELKVRTTADDYGKVWYGLVP